MKKHIGKMVPVVVLLVAAGAGLWAWETLFRTGSADITLYGNVDQRQVELAFLDAERVREVLVQEGEVVRPGQVLARLETRRLRDEMAVTEARVAAAQAALLRLENGTRPEEIEQARASVASARASLVYAEADLARHRDLWQASGGRAVSRRNLDQAILEHNVARARLVEAEKALRLAEIGPRDEDIAEARARLAEARNSLASLRTRLEDAELKSPALSVVNRRLLEPGDMASPSRAVFSLAVLDPKWVRAYVSETQLGHVRPGMPAMVFSDSHPDSPVPGTVGFVSSVAEFTPKSVETTDLRTSLVYEVRVYVKDSRDILRLGMPVTVQLRRAGPAEGTGEVPSRTGQPEPERR